jgi:homoserine O-acetyltransferase
MVLDDLGVNSVAICIGASMAGMHAFEWAFFLDDTQGSSPFVKTIVPISAPAKSSAWSMGWTEAQRQAIFADPKYIDGYYSLDSVSSLRSSHNEVNNPLFYIYNTVISNHVSYPVLIQFCENKKK